ncbi:MAG: hypothetical protein JW801_00955 [Bacteroidales bacterium]|nr:hypothetical protein [Bacteroidales bacterium]
MKKIKTKLLVGIFSIFLVSFILLMVNIGANNRIANNSKALLVNNYTSIKYSIEMLNHLDMIYDILQSQNILQQSVDESLIILEDIFEKIVKEFQTREH